ncbi:carbon-nitrogen hydrolase family protein [Rhizobium sp. XQZ8]|uniref:carbon-nitrogen hydrolase family protein n=1 Tax=Rhizobium populisoli TaxID=2859785 RepID=UPI001CA56C26|nr:carbon-nitrogen hydrolase family protein [Rhizobium populisoli]MBW6421062.1 carbon-nitrogen hydrolase family protein [Rhizobium populisoli]
MKTVRIAAAQTPEIRNDIPAALACLNDFAAQAEAEGARLLCFPEGFLQGYLLDEASARRVALDLASPEFETVLRQFPQTGPTIVVGMIEAAEGHLFNTALVIEQGKVAGRYRKVHLLGGETIFEAGTGSNIFEIDGLRFGINICYDTNFPDAARGVADLGASLIVCCANNMMPRAKAEIYRDVHNSARGERCRETGLWLVSSDVTGERDGRIAWGPTAVLDPEGRVVAQLPLDEPGLLVFDLPVGE